MRGTVKEFRPEAGFGKLALEDGSEIAFDVAASNKRDVRVGEPCEVTIGKGLRGQPKVTLVEFPLEGDRTTSLKEFLAYAHRNGLLSEWTPEGARQAGRDLDIDPKAIDREAAAALIEAYYGHGPTERARRDRVLAIDWRHAQEVENIVGVMAQVADIDGLTAADQLDGSVVVRDGDVEQSVDLTGTLQALTDFFDEAFARRGRSDRWLSLSTETDFEIFALRDAKCFTQSKTDLPLFG